MIFDKTATTVDAQIALLKDRGMAIENESHAYRCLSTIGYYRLSAYWLTYEETPTEGQTRSKKFRAGTNFDDIYDTYVFDRKLRVLLMEAIERIEIHVRTCWTSRMTLAHGAHAHLDYRLFSSSTKHAVQLAKLTREVDRSNEKFIDHYKKKYRDPDIPPLWAATELMTFGELSKWLTLTKDAKILSAVARDFNLPTKETLGGVLQVLAYVRNICAHHGRLWNRRLVKRIPNIKRMRDDLEVEIIKGQRQLTNRLYNVLTIVLHLLHNQNTDTTFPERLKRLLETINEDQRNMMGFPVGWRGRPVWRDA